MARIVKTALRLILLAMSIVAFSSEDVGLVWLSYEPAVVAIAGRVHVEKAYGSPEFGLRPETDEVSDNIFLYPFKPINVHGDPRDELNNQNFIGITKIQLYGDVIDVDTFIDNFIDKDMLVTGTLSVSATEGQ